MSVTANGNAEFWSRVPSTPKITNELPAVCQRIPISNFSNVLSEGNVPRFCNIKKKQRRRWQNEKSSE